MVWTPYADWIFTVVSITSLLVVVVAGTTAKSFTSDDVRTSTDVLATLPPSSPLDSTGAYVAANPADSSSLRLS